MTAARQWNLRVSAADLAAWGTPLLLIVFLAMNNGGFDPVARPEVGVVVWWTVLVGTALNVLPAAGGTRAGRVLLALLAAFAAWTALAMTWTESEERTATEMARVSTYLGVFVLALAAQGGGRWRHVLNGVTAGIVIVCGVAVMSRIEPSWFPDQHVGRYLVGIEIQSRLAYPLNYSSGLGAFAVMGLPLALAGTATARTIAGQALAAAAIPLLAVTLWLTTSSLSVPVVVIALLAFLVLAPDRLPKVATLAIAGAGAAVLIAAVEARDAFGRGLPTPLEERQGDEMLLIILVACGAVALAQAGLGVWLRRGQRPTWLRVPRRSAAIATAVVVAIGVIVAIVAGLPGRLDHEWGVFKGRGGELEEVNRSSRAAQIFDFSGSGRYQFWQASADAFESEPLHGIGPGTFDLWWTRNGSYEGYTRDAHSLYLETLGELGIVGFALIVALSLGILGVGAWRALRAPPHLRLGLAAATAGCAAFVAGATVDWVWELGVLPVTFLTLAAVACAAGAEPRRAAPGSRAPWWRRHGPQAVVVAVAIAALAMLYQPLRGAIAMERSYEAAADGDVRSALDHARDAASAQPYAATPRIQEALLLQSLGNLDAALAAAREGTEREPTNWLTWLVLARIERRSDHPELAARAQRRAESLNPLVLG